MASVFQPLPGGVWLPRNEYETQDMTVQDAIEAVIGCRGDWAHGEEYRIIPGEQAGLKGYGDAVMIERESVDDNGVYGDYEPYLIIAE